MQLVKDDDTEGVDGAGFDGGVDESVGLVLHT